MIVRVESAIVFHFERLALLHLVPSYDLRDMEKNFVSWPLVLDEATHCPAWVRAWLNNVIDCIKATETYESKPIDPVQVIIERVVDPPTKVTTANDQPVTGCFLFKSDDSPAHVRLTNRCAWSQTCWRRYIDLPFQHNQLFFEQVQASLEKDYKLVDGTDDTYQVDDPVKLSSRVASIYSMFHKWLTAPATVEADKECSYLIVKAKDIKEDLLNNVMKHFDSIDYDTYSNSMSNFTEAESIVSSLLRAALFLTSSTTEFMAASRASIHSDIDFKLTLEDMLKKQADKV